jgi:hypothetical protein
VTEREKKREQRKESVREGEEIRKGRWKRKEKRKEEPPLMERRNDSKLPQPFLICFLG